MAEEIDDSSNPLPLGCESGSGHAVVEGRGRAGLALEPAAAAHCRPQCKGQREVHQSLRTRMTFE